ncbi:MAG: carboxymuconolactone decarboxylase family protein [Actinomycetota bacterium]|nr:carboxymuconolactone decarboxylase family protein [Actinomycetota bacterium]
MTTPRIDIPDGPGDPEVRVWALRPEMGMGAGALSHAIYDQSIVPVRERELARMRIAQINGCLICRQWRKTKGAADALTEADYSHVEEWATYAGYDERDRLAVEYAERFALDHQNLDDAFWTRMKAAYSDAEILDLTVCIGGWIGMGRTLQVLGIDSYCALPH